MNKTKHTILLVVSIFVALIQTSFIFSLSQTPIIHLSLLLSIIAFFYIPILYAFLYASISMFFIDVYSTTPLGSSVVSILFLLGMAFAITRTVLPHKSLAAKLLIAALLSVGYALLVSLIEYVQLAIFESGAVSKFSPKNITPILWLTVFHVLCMFIIDKIQSRPRWFKPRPYIVRSQ